MAAENVMHFFWPEMSGTVSIVALVVALIIFVFAMFSGALANKIRIVFAVCLSTAIGWFAMPLFIKGASVLGIIDTKSGAVILVTVMMFFVAAVATSIYEIITVTFPDIGMSPRK
jgi:hypothetical protein